MRSCFASPAQLVRLPIAVKLVQISSIQAVSRPEKKHRCPASTVGSVSYVRAPAGGKDIFRYLYELPEGKPATNLERQEETVTVQSVRGLPDLTLHKNGVQLCKFQVPEDIDWSNEEDVKEKYYPLVSQFLKDLTGATRVHVFDNTVRNGHLKPQETGRFDLEAQGQPVGMVHVDYTVLGGLQRLSTILPDDAEQLKKTPFAVIQVWRPLKGPVKSSPLGFIDASSVDKKDLINYRLHFPGRTGYNYGVQYNPNHRWFYAEGMRTDEAYAFVCYDSRNDRARFTPHTAFRDENAVADAPPRESVEIRSYCFWENEAPQEPVTTL